MFVWSVLETGWDLLLHPAHLATHSSMAISHITKSFPQSQRAVLQLKGRISELEAELAEQQHLRQQAADESEFLRAELDELKKKREDTEKAQRSLTEIESERLVGEGVRVWVTEISQDGGGWVAESHSALHLSRGAVSSASSRHQSEGDWSPAGRAPV